MGSSVTQISRKVGINRNAVVKYLDVLEANGQLESQVVGSARMFYLSRRPPLSALVGLSDDLICTIDRDRKITFANDRFLDFFSLDPRETFHREIEGIPINDGGHISFSALFTESPEDPGKHSLIQVDRYEKRIIFRREEIRTRFEDGSAGITYIFSDVTAEKERLDNLEFLARTSAELADMGEDANIYQYIADRIADLEPKAHVMVNSINPEAMTRTFRAFAGDGECIQAMFDYLGDMRGGSLPIGGNPEAFGALSRGRLYEGPSSFFAQAYRAIPEHIANEMQERLNLRRGYAMGCTCRGGLFGNVALRYRNNDDVRHPETIEAFVDRQGLPSSDST